MLFALFRSCVVGTWAVRRGLSLSESDSRLVCSKVTLAAHVGSCMLPSGRDGDRVYAVKTVSVVTFFWEVMPCLMHTLPEGRACCLCVWSTRESLALCQIHCSCRITVNHRVVWHIILILRYSMRAFSAFSWLSLQCL